MPSDYKFGFIVIPFRKRHWIAIRRIDNIYWNLDSKISKPERIGNENELRSYLNAHLQSNDKELFVVVSKENEENRLWLKSNDNCDQK